MLPGGDVPISNWRPFLLHRHAGFLTVTRTSTCPPEGEAHRSLNCHSPPCNRPCKRLCTPCKNLRTFPRTHRCTRLCSPYSQLRTQPCNHRCIRRYTLCTPYSRPSRPPYKQMCILCCTRQHKCPNRTNYMRLGRSGALRRRGRKKRRSLQSALS